MPRGDSGWLTTGAVARLCSVTPDTVQKWIKSRRLVAQRTAGGHYRIAVGDVQPFVTVCENSRWYAAPPKSCTPQPLRCWEYFAENGVIRERCTQCVVYRVRASWCFEVLGIPGAEHARAFCRTQGGCASCPYYQQVFGTVMTVLVVTRNADLIASLEAGSKEPTHLELRYAQSAYDVSSEVAAFRPAFVVLDFDSVRDASDILDHLLRDDRIPGVRVILCARGTEGLTSSPERIIRATRKPLDRAGLEQAIRSIPIERQG